MVCRKSDVRKKGFTRGWELILSHNFMTGITSGFYNGTPTSDIVECIAHLKGCIQDTGHPLLLSSIIFSHTPCVKAEERQRAARDWLRRIEYALSIKVSYTLQSEYAKDGVLDLKAINRDVIECYSQMLLSEPSAHLKILESLEKAAVAYDKVASVRNSDRTVQGLHSRLMYRLEFCAKRWQGIQAYATTSKQRIQIQKELVGYLIRKVN